MKVILHYVCFSLYLVVHMARHIKKKYTGDPCTECPHDAAAIEVNVLAMAA